MPAAKISDLITQRLDAPAGVDELVTETDVADPKVLARLLNRLRKDVGGLVRERPRRVSDFEDRVVSGNGKQLRLPHHFGGRARWTVIGWQAANPGLDFHTAMWVRRAMFGPLTMSTFAGDFTVGNRFQATERVRVAGVRFPWFTGGSAHTVTAKLWRDSDGATLGSGTVSANESGMYVALFDSPVELDGANLNVDLTVSVYNSARYTKTGVDGAFTGLLNLKLPGFLLKSLVLWSAGNARPTSSAGAELYWCEPYVSTPAPQLVEDQSTTGTDDNTLVLKSYSPGVVSIRVEKA